MPRCYDGSETFLGRVTHRDIRDTCVTCHVSHIPQGRARCYNQTITLIVSDALKYRWLNNAFKLSRSMWPWLREREEHKAQMAAYFQRMPSWFPYATVDDGLLNTRLYV